MAKKDKKSNKDKSNVYLVNLNDENPIELRDKKFKKQILRTGSWFHEDARGGVFKVTRDKLKELYDNWKHKVVENVPVLRGHHAQSEVDANPNLIAADTVNLEIDDEGLYAVMETTDDEADNEIGNKYKNVSASIDENYIDHETGDKRGWVLRHIALTTEPYIKGLNPEFVSLSDEYDKPVVSLNLSDKNMEEKTTDLQDEEQKEEPKEEVKEEVKEDKEEPKEEKKEEVAEEKSETPVLTKVEKTPKEEKPKEEEEPELEVVDEEIEEPEKEPEETEGSEKDVKPLETSEESAKPKAKEVNETGLSSQEQKIKDLEKKVLDLELKETEATLNTYLSEGKITPAQRDEALALLKSKGTVNLGEGESESVAGLFKSFIKKMSPQVDFSERGVQIKTKEDSDKGPESNLGLSPKEMKRALNLYPNQYSK